MYRFDHYTEKDKEKVIDFMKENVIGHGQTDGQRIADKVNVVTTRGEFFAQFGRDDAAAAIRRVTGDPDLHISIT